MSIRKAAALLATTLLATAALLVLAAPAEARDYLFNCDVTLNGAPVEVDPVTVPVTGTVNGAETVAVSNGDTVSLADVQSVLNLSLAPGTVVNVSEMVMRFPIPTGLTYVAASGVWSGSDPTASVALSGSDLIVTTGAFTFTTGTPKTLGDLAADFTVTATSGEMPFIAGSTTLTGTVLGLPLTTSCTTTDTGYFACAGIGAVCGAPPPPLVPTPEISLGATTVEAGGQVSVTGESFLAGSTVNFAINPALGTATVGSDGTFAASLTIPASLAPGTYQLSATGEDANGEAATAEATLTVTAPGTTPDAPPTLPRTGNPVGALVLGGLALAGVGVVLLRTRRHLAA